MEIPSESTTTVCSHCERAIPSPNIDLHFAYCSRNLEKCTICGNMVPKKHGEEHYRNTHAPVACSLCSETVDREVIARHKGESCPQRIVTCEYCELPLPAVDLFQHQEVCGNRTDFCDRCNKYIRRHEWNDHEIQHHSHSLAVAESSRNATAPEREHGPPRRQARGLSQRRLLLTIAITGIAVLIGSIFFQRRTENHQ